MQTPNLSEAARAKGYVRAQKFEKTDKKRIRGRVKHTRTGACTCRRGQVCQHGKNYTAHG